VTGGQPTTGSVIASAHRTAESLAHQRSRFAEHPARVVAIDDFLDADLARRLNRFLAEEADFYVEYGTYTEDPVDESTFTNAPDDDRFFRMRKLAGTKPEHRMSLNALTYLRFRSSLGEPEILSFFEHIAGVPLRSTDDVGVHAMKTGDFLRPHSDANKDRQLAFIIYLSETWSQDYGGVLEVLASDGSITRIVPRFNMLVAFDVLADSQHLITPITDAAGERSRFTIGGWYSRAN
jgi:Rps23 Pro-64 3,4-dihydroxylase Tpa1-like proline 4-hydroxylase